MPLESCMICMDNSEWMRNGDFAPDRLAQMTDTVQMLVNRLLNAPAHPESTLGLLTMAGKRVEVRASPTRDDYKLRSAMHGVHADGKVNFVHALKIAFLALKHRLNKAGQQRIVVFLGSPIEDKDATLKRLAKDLRKNNVGVDVVSMGEHEANEARLQTFVEAVNKEDNSHLVVVSPGSNLSSAVMQSPVAGDAAAAGGGGGGLDQYGGADPNVDPDLAMALMASMREEEERQRRDGDEGGEDQQQGGGGAPAAGAPAGGFEDEDALLQQALALSMQEAAAAGGGGESEPAAAPAAATAAAAGGSIDSDAAPGASGDGDDDEAELAAALALSQQEDQERASGGGAPAPADEQAMFNNPDFVQSLLGDLPGVDLNDPQLQAMMGSLAGGHASGGGEGKDGEGKDGEGKDDQGGSGSGSGSGSSQQQQ